MANRLADIDRAREAIRRASWAEAYEELRALDPSGLAPEDLEGMADAAWWLSKREESIVARREAYSRYASAGQDRRAAFTAGRLFMEHFFAREPAEATGWLMRGQRHLQGEADCIERGYLILGQAYLSHVRGDPAGAQALAEQATAFGQRFDDRDLVAMGIDAQGRALISRGMVAEGMALLDEAMVSVIEGNLSPFITGTIYCNVLDACLQLADLGRAGEWTEAAAAWCETLPSEALFVTLCRIHRVQLATYRGAWAKAEADALIACRASFHPTIVGAAFYSTGEVRRRVGNLAGAEEAFMRAHELGFEPQPGLALLRLGQGKTDTALAGLRVAMVGEPADALRRSALLTAMVEVAIAAGELEEARTAADELESIARDFGSAVLEAAAATARGSVQLSEGEASAALANLRRASAIWQDLKLPYETAQTRMLIGAALRTAGAEEDARLELQAVGSAFERLGATADARRAAELLGEATSAPRGLTARQVEILRLVATGKTNREIAAQLFLSEHTVARHVQNVFTKLDVSSRAAATAFAFEHGLV